jgi:hypothetical protein
VAVACHHDRIPGARRAFYGCEDAARAAVYERERRLAPEERRRARRQGFQDALRILKIVEAVDLGDVDRPGQAVPQKLRVALVPRHVKRRDAFFRIATERLIKHGNPSDKRIFYSGRDVNNGLPHVSRETAIKNTNFTCEQIRRTKRLFVKHNRKAF